ncbi:MAG: helix-turn-helix transcriptional regulator, partial [Eggerthellaceae bacterium]|nr:helix-turn-helix transcriptional regulator [Eggerthellaceae bacterium]
MTGAELCRALRAKANLTQQEFADLLGVSFATVNRWENSRTSPAPSAKRKLSSFAASMGLAIAEESGSLSLTAVDPTTVDANREERLSKLRAAELFDTDILDTFEVGTYAGLARIHRHLFRDVFAFA